MVKLLQSDSLVLSEVNVFNIVASWRQTNTDTDDLLLKCVRLCWMDIEDIISTVAPTNIYDSKKMVSIANEINGNTRKSEKCRRPKGNTFNSFCTSN